MPRLAVPRIQVAEATEKPDIVPLTTHWIVPQSTVHPWATRADGRRDKQGRVSSQAPYVSEASRGGAGGNGAPWRQSAEIQAQKCSFFLALT